MDHIVVGVDRSASGRRALAVAVEEGRRRGAAVHAVTCWLPEYCNGYEATPGLTDAASALAALAEAEAELAPAHPPIARVVVRGRPASVLAEVAEGADLVVVGAGDRRWWTRLLWGSVPRELAARTAVEVRVVDHVDPAPEPSVVGLAPAGGSYAAT